MIPADRGSPSKATISQSVLTRKIGEGKSKSVAGVDVCERDRGGGHPSCGGPSEYSSWMVAWTWTDTEGPEGRDRWPGTNFGFRALESDELEESRLSRVRSMNN